MPMIIYALRRLHQKRAEQDYHQVSLSLEIQMKPYLLLIISLLAAGVFGQDQPKRIGQVEFFGYSGIDLNKVRAGAMSVPERQFQALVRRRVPR